MIPAGDGAASAAGNPFEQFGLNPDGTAATKPGDDGKGAADLTAQQATKIAGLEGQLKDLVADKASTAEKLKILDRLSSVLTGKDLPDPNTEGFVKLFGEMKDVFRVASPAMYKLLTAVEKDPDLLDRMQQQQDALAGHTLGTLNAAAHNNVMQAAKGFWKGYTEAELQESVLPYEKTITDVINANKDLKGRFLSGDASVVTEIFNRLVKPHVSARLRSKQAQLKPSGLPGAPPRGGAAAGDQGGDDDSKPLVRQRGADGKSKFNVRTPQGRMEFHRAAVGRFADRAARGSDD